jgi:hypothetical protein
MAARTCCRQVARSESSPSYPSKHPHWNGRQIYDAAENAGNCWQMDTFSRRDSGSRLLHEVQVHVFFLLPSCYI